MTDVSVMRSDTTGKCVQVPSCEPTNRVPVRATTLTCRRMSHDEVTVSPSRNSDWRTAGAL